MKANWYPWNALRAAAFWGSLVWLALIFIKIPDLQQDYWARLLLQLAMLVWVPLGLSLLNDLPHVLTRLAFPAGLAAVVSLQLPVSWLAAGFALPWLLLCSLLFISGVAYLSKGRMTASRVALAGAQIFIIIGGLSLLADRLGLQPLGFDPAIVLLTAVHFHYAGFVFLLFLGLAAKHMPGQLFRLAAWLAILSVPLTALGITLTQVIYSFWVEALAAVIVSLAGWLGATGYVLFLFKKNIPVGVRLCWALMALSLVFTMILSAGYALRSYFALDALTIPEMRVWHGTANALGVAGFGLAGWLLADIRRLFSVKC